MPVALRAQETARTRQSLLKLGPSQLEGRLDGFPGFDGVSRLLAEAERRGAEVQQCGGKFAMSQLLVYDSVTGLCLTAVEFKEMDQGVAVPRKLMPECSFD